MTDATQAAAKVAATRMGRSGIPQYIAERIAVLLPKEIE